MALSEQTIAELRAGAAAVAVHASKDGIDPAYMDAMIRTQQRARWLKTLEKEGKIRIVITQRMSMQKRDPVTNEVLRAATHVVWVGEEQFDDPAGELVGAWPSEVLVAQIALALSAGVGDKKDDV